MFSVQQHAPARSLFTSCPSPVRMVDNLRARGHPYNLPECSTNVHKKSFVVRSLYSFI